MLKMSIYKVYSSKFLEYPISRSSSLGMAERHIPDRHYIHIPDADSPVPRWSNGHLDF